MTKGLISIIIPTYNRAHLIQETLDSIIEQTYTDWECIIVDDGSTDNTEEIITDYIRKDQRFQYHKRPVDRIKGANACRNYGFNLSKGEYVKWFDSDDIMNPLFLEKQIEVLESNKNYDFCICLANELSNDINKTIYKANRLIKFDKLTAYLVKNHYFFTASPLWTRKFLENKELFDETLFDSQETDFHFRMLDYPTNYVYTNDVLFSIRRGHSSITQDISNKITSNISRLIFFIKAYKIVSNNNKVSDKNTLLLYILYRQLGIFSYLCINNYRNFAIKYLFIIIKNIYRTKISLRQKCSIFIGLMTQILFKKGYHLFRKIKPDIIEVIEN